MDLNWVELIGYGSTALTIATYSMKTIVPLRVVSIATSFFSIAYASILGIWPMLLTSLVVLPLNSIRLYQILKLMRQIKHAPDGAYLVEWLHPFSVRRRHKAGQVVFRRGDSASSMLLIEGGKYQLIETGEIFTPGDLVGEIGFVSPDHRRTLSLICVEPGTVGEVSYSDVRQLYFQNPQFGYFFLQLVGSHLVDKLQDARGELIEIRTQAAAE